MNEPIRILNGDGRYPVCSQAGCRMLALAGYCEAGCCVGFNPRKAYCSEHSHQPERVLEILGHSTRKESFTRAEVRKILLSIWHGAGLVMENAGKFEMERDIEMARSAAAQREQHREMIDLMSDPGVGEVVP